MYDAMSINKLLATSLQGHGRWLLSMNPLESENQAVAQSQSLVLNDLQVKSTEQQRLMDVL